MIDGVGAVVASGAIDVAVGVGAEVLHTGAAYARAELEVVDEGEVTHEVLVVDAPSDCTRGEETVAVVGSEHRRAVVAAGECEQVAVEQTVVDAGE